MPIKNNEEFSVCKKVSIPKRDKKLITMVHKASNFVQTNATIEIIMKIEFDASKNQPVKSNLSPTGKDNVYAIEDFFIHSHKGDSPSSVID